MSYNSQVCTLDKIKSLKKHVLSFLVAITLTCKTVSVWFSLSPVLWCVAGDDPRTFCVWPGIVRDLVVEHCWERIEFDPTSVWPRHQARSVFVVSHAKR